MANQTMSAKNAQDQTSLIIHDLQSCGNFRTIAAQDEPAEGPQLTTFAARFWAKVERKSVNDCWLWLGNISPRGYGRLREYPGSPRTIQAHRVSYELANGVTLDPSIVIRHECDNPPCVNPAHLLAGTYADNRADCVRRGRVAKGMASGTARLTDDSVRLIRTSNEESSVLAQRLGVSWDAVHRVRKGRTWTHVEVNQ